LTLRTIRSTCRTPCGKVDLPSGECTDGTAESFDQARVGEGACWEPDDEKSLEKCRFPSKKVWMTAKSIVIKRRGNEHNFQKAKQALRTARRC
jgi:hypothetical protein